MALGDPCFILGEIIVGEDCESLEAGDGFGTVYGSCFLLGSSVIGVACGAESPTPPEEGEEFEGEAALTASAVLSCEATLIPGGGGTEHDGEAALTGSGTLDADADLVAAGSTSLAGSGTVSSDVDLVAAGSTSLAGSGTVSSDVDLEASAVSTITGTATLAANGVKIQLASVVLTASASTSFDADLLASGLTSITGSGTLDADADLVAAGSTSLTGNGTVSPDGDLEASAVSTITGTATLIANVSKTQFLSAALTASASTSFDADLVAAGSTSLAGSGTVSTDGDLEASAVSTITGTATFSADAIKARFASASLTGTATFSADANLLAKGIVSSSATATLVCNGSNEAVANCTLNATATLTAVGLRSKYVSAAINGVATLAASASVVKINIGTGGVLCGGEAIVDVGHNPKPPKVGGGVVCGGDAYVRVISKYRAKNGVRVGGGSKSRYKYTGEGSILVYGTVGSGDAAADGPNAGGLNVTYRFSQEVVWAIQREFVKSKTIRYDIGEQPFRWYRVVGCCQYPTAAGDGTGAQPGGCEVGPLETLDEKCVGQSGKNQFVQNILARDIGELCQILTDMKWRWPICSLQRFSRPADPRLSQDECNRLEEVTYCDVPGCFDFCLQSDPITHMAMEVSVAVVKPYSNITGGITLSGSALAGIVWPSAEGSGEIILSGEAERACSHWTTEGTGDIVLSGSGLMASSYWNYVGSGTIVTSGEAEIVSPSWHYRPSGGLVLSNTALARVALNFIPSGSSLMGIHLGGDAEYPIHVLGSGGIVLGGSALASTPFAEFNGEGTITLGGEASVVSPSWHYEGSGGITGTGEIEYNYLSLAYETTGEGIVLGGSAEVRNSLDGDFWYTALQEAILLSGEGECAITAWRYSGSGTISTTGVALVNSNYLGVFETSMVMESSLESEEMIFGNIEQPNLTPLAQVVGTACGSCVNMPLVLNLSHNLENASILREFMMRNGLGLNEPILLHYNRLLKAWHGSIHLLGNAAGNIHQQEAWRFSFEWACADSIADESMNSAWKFSLFVNRKNLTTNTDFDTRIMIIFPPEDLCASSNLGNFDFSFRVNTAQKYVKTSESMSVESMVFYDNIGMFKSRTWRNDPNLNLKVSSNFTPDENYHVDLSSIFPEKPLLVNS